MLVLSRHKEESIIIGDNIEVKVIGIHGHNVRLGIQAPGQVPIHRREVHLRTGGAPQTEVVVDAAQSGV